MTKRAITNQAASVHHRLANGCWKNVKSRCGGQIGSLIELLQGKLSKGVMEIVTRRDGGMFPTPAEIEMSCSCPDWAGMCKHVAATLYGIGNRERRSASVGLHRN